MTDIEKKRLQEVEEAVIKFGNIAEIVLVDMKDRVRILEKSNTYLFWRCMTIIGVVFLIFIGAVVYFNGENKDMIAKKTSSHRAIYAKISKHRDKATATATHMDTVIKSLDKINDKLDSMVTHQHSRGK